MTENKPITVYTADCIGNAANCRYPNEVNITDGVTAKLAFSKDMVCAKYKNGHRSVSNFETATMTTRIYRQIGSPRRILRSSLPMFPMYCTTAATT